MGTIIVSENLTLDGVIQDPTGEESTTFGGWFTRIGDADREAWTEVEMEENRVAAALLLGGRTYEWMAERWQDREGAWGDRLRELPKYVVSSTLDQPSWTNTSVLTGEAEKAVAELKEQIDGEIVVYGSGALVQTLVAHDLVDELRLMVFPSVVGAGEHLFRAAGPGLRLTDARMVGESLVLLTYRVDRTS
jgi:dihydrofolate reductase